MAIELGVKEKLSELHRVTEIPRMLSFKIEFDGLAVLSIAV